MIELLLELNGHLKKYKVRTSDKQSYDEWLWIVYRNKTFRISRNRMVYAKPVKVKGDKINE